MNVRQFVIGGAIAAAVIAIYLYFSPSGAGKLSPDAQANLDDATRRSHGLPAIRGEVIEQPASRAAWKPPVVGNTSSAIASVPLPPINTPLATVVDDLRERARHGDARAACRLAFELERCRLIPIFRKVALERRLRAEREPPLSEMRQRLRQAADHWDASVRKDEPPCEGFDSNDSRGGWQYALQAAQAGHVPSMIRFVSGWMLSDGGSPGENLDGWIALRDLGPVFLQTGIDQGYPEAYEEARYLYMMGNMRGIPFPRDPVLSVAYSTALARVGTPSERQRSLANAESTARRANLSSADIARAQALAEPLVAKLLARNAPDSVDFTKGTYGKDDGSHCD